MAGGASKKPGEKAGRLYGIDSLIIPEIEGKRVLPCVYREEAGADGSGKLRGSLRR